MGTDFIFDPDHGTVAITAQGAANFPTPVTISWKALAAASSEIQDANIAEEVVNLTRFQILSQAATLSLQKANQNSQSNLSLLA